MKTQNLIDVSRNVEYKDVYSKTIEILQCTRILKANFAVERFTMYA